jgi:hypothetical protein
MKLAALWLGLASSDRGGIVSYSEVAVREPV